MESEDSRFDDITKLCCLIFKVPIALVAIVDEGKQTYKSVQGLDIKLSGELTLFSRWTPKEAGVLAVPDARADPRFCKDPLVTGPPHIRFYAAAPLLTSDGKDGLGSLCIMDTAVRPFGPESHPILANMGEMVVREIEKDLLLKQQKQKAARLVVEKTMMLNAMDCFRDGIVMVNTALPQWPIVLVNEAFERITGLSRADCSKGFWDVFQGMSDEPVVAMKDRSMAMIVQRLSFYLQCQYGPEDSRRSLALTFRCASKANLDAYTSQLQGLPAAVANSQTDGSGGSYYFATLAAPPHGHSGMSSGSHGSGGGGRFSSGHTLVGTAGAEHSKLSPTISGSSGYFRQMMVMEKLDPFEDVRLGPLLGRGAFGRVYRGWWNTAQVAVKVLNHTRASSDLGDEIMEALFSGQVAHPNVVKTYRHFSRPLQAGAGDDDEEDEAGVVPLHQPEDLMSDGVGDEKMETWMIMEFCDKGTIAEAVDRGWFRDAQTFESDYQTMIMTAREIAGAMSFLHDRNILHGNLTRNNILLASSEKDSRRFTAKVADSGLRKILAGPNAVLRKTYGAVTHMPPEYLLDGIFEKPADVYAYGIIMWELFMGQRPYAGMSHGQIVHCITSHKVMPLSSSCPTPIKKFLQKCYAPQAALRPTFPKVLEMLEDLEQDLLS